VEKVERYINWRGIYEEQREKYIEEYRSDSAFGSGDRY